mgnify:CR=1 FL=1
MCTYIMYYYPKTISLLAMSNSSFCASLKTKKAHKKCLAPSVHESFMCRHKKTLSSLLQHLGTLNFLASDRRSKMRSNLDENVSLSTPFFNCFFDFMRKKFQWGEKSLLLFPNTIVVVGGVLSAPQFYAFCNNNAKESIGGWMCV